MFKFNFLCLFFVATLSSIFSKLDRPTPEKPAITRKTPPKRTLRRRQEAKKKLDSPSSKKRLSNFRLKKEAVALKNQKEEPLDSQDKKEIRMASPKEKQADSSPVKPAPKDELLEKIGNVDERKDNDLINYEEVEGFFITIEELDSQIEQLFKDTEKVSQDIGKEYADLETQIDNVNVFFNQRKNAIYNMLNSVKSYLFESLGKALEPEVEVKLKQMQFLLDELGVGFEKFVANLVILKNAFDRASRLANFEKTDYFYNVAGIVGQSDSIKNQILNLDNEEFEKKENLVAQLRDLKNNAQESYDYLTNQLQVQFAEEKENVIELIEKLKVELKDLEKQRVLLEDQVGFIAAVKEDVASNPERSLIKQFSSEKKVKSENKNMSNLEKSAVIQVELEDEGFGFSNIIKFIGSAISCFFATVVDGAKSFYKNFFAEQKDDKGKSEKNGGIAKLASSVQYFFEGIYELTKEFVAYVSSKYQDYSGLPNSEKRE